MSEPILYYDDLKVGDRWVSEQRELRQEDVQDFAEATGDYNPLHIDPEFAAATPFGKPIAHGMLGLAWAIGLSSEQPNVSTLAFVEIRNWRFVQPLYPGDVVHASAEIVALEPARRRSGKVTWKRSLLNQDGEILQVGEFVTLVETMAAAMARSVG